MRKMFNFVALIIVLSIMSCSVQSQTVNIDGQAEVNGYGEGTMVKQFYGRLEASGTAPQYYGQFKGMVEIENAAYEKQVTVHWAYVTYGDQAISEWYDLPATYVKSLGNNKELWTWNGEKFMIPFYSSKRIVYAIKYVVNGVEYWDNNNGEDYEVAIGYGAQIDPVVLSKSVVILKKVSLGGNETQSYFSGEIYAQDNVDAQIDIVYSADGWNTVHTCTARQSGYDPNSYFFTEYLPAGVQSVDLAVSYSENGWTAWDNNFGDDYHVVAP